LAEGLAKGLGFKLVKGVDFGIILWREGDRTYRGVLAVEPEDLIMVNGIVIGRALDRDVVFVCESGRIVEVRGAELKPRGLRKLGHVDLERAKIDSVKLLRDEVKSRARVGYPTKNKIVFIDHDGYEVFKFLDEGICCAVTVGDDTTAVVSDVLERFGVPVIGIVDGDEDGLLRGRRLHPSSVILKVRSDDAFGKEVFEKLFQGRGVIEGDFEYVKLRILELLSRHSNAEEP